MVICHCREGSEIRLYNGRAQALPAIVVRRTATAGLRAQSKGHREERNK